VSAVVDTAICYWMLKAGGSAWNVVEDGFMYEKVRLCQAEPGTFDDCEKP
jgi:hypothetical protein